MFRRSLDYPADLQKLSQFILDNIKAIIESDREQSYLKAHLVAQKNAISQILDQTSNFQSVSQAVIGACLCLLDMEQGTKEVARNAVAKLHHSAAKFPSHNVMFYSLYLYCTANKYLAYVTAVQYVQKVSKPDLVWPIDISNCDLSEVNFNKCKLAPIHYAYANVQASVLKYLPDIYVLLEHAQGAGDNLKGDFLAQVKAKILAFAQADACPVETHEACRKILAENKDFSGWFLGKTPTSLTEFNKINPPEMAVSNEVK